MKFVSVDKYPERIKNWKEYMERLKRDAAEGKTTIKSQMNPLALKEWEERKVKEKVPKDHLENSAPVEATETSENS